MNELLNENDTNEISERTMLATIQRIKSIEPIEGKDFIELVSFYNCSYKCVCEKGLHNINDLVCFIKYESVVPDIEMFGFMREYKFRVKAKSFTTSNGKIYSQGIVIPLLIISNYLDYTSIDDFEECDDLTLELKVKKYMLPVKGTSSRFGQMKSAGDFPSHLVSKTDELNVQIYTKLFDELKGLNFYITCKLDGSSMTCLIDDDYKFRVCSRNNILQYADDNAFWKVAIKYDIENILRNLYVHEGKRYAIQGELVGQKIQSNKMNLNELDFYVFNIVDIDTRKREPFSIQYSLCIDCQLKHVPLFQYGESFNYTLNDLIKLSASKTYKFFNFDSNHPIEGLVVRTSEDKISFKVMNPEFK